MLRLTVAVLLHAAVAVAQAAQTLQPAPLPGDTLTAEASGSSIKRDGTRKLAHAPAPGRPGAAEAAAPEAFAAVLHPARAALLAAPPVAVAPPGASAPSPGVQVGGKSAAAAPSRNEALAALHLDVGHKDFPEVHYSSEFDDPPAPPILPRKPASGAPRPHIVLVLIDDMGWANVRWNGRPIRSSLGDGLLGPSRCDASPPAPPPPLLHGVAHFSCLACWLEKLNVVRAVTVCANHVVTRHHLNRLATTTRGTSIPLQWTSWLPPA